MKENKSGCYFSEHEISFLHNCLLDAVKEINFLVFFPLHKRYDFIIKIQQTN